MGQPGIGVLIGMLGGNAESVKAFTGAVGKTIAGLTLGEDDALHFVFDDGSKVKLYDDGQSCCESRYMRTDDRLVEYVGAKLLGATASWPLPKTHRLYAEGHNVPPMPLRMGTDNPERQAMNQKVWAAAKYAVRSATMNGKEPDFDPDALCQNMVVGLLGYHTADGLSSDSWANPPQAEPGA